MPFLHPPLEMRKHLRGDSRWSASDYEQAEMVDQMFGGMTATACPHGFSPRMREIKCRTAGNGFLAQPEDFCKLPPWQGGVAGAREKKLARNWNAFYEAQLPARAPPAPVGVPVAQTTHTVVGVPAATDIAALATSLIKPSVEVRDAARAATADEERAEQAEQAKQARDAEQKRRQAVHDAMMAAQEAEAKAREARRKYDAALARAARAAAPAKPYTPRQEPPKSKKKAKLQQRAAKRAGATKEAYTAATLEHGVWVLPEQQELRAEHGKEKQALEHAEKVARLAQEKLAALRKLEADMSKAREAATHVVAPPATLSGLLSAAMARIAF